VDGTAKDSCWSRDIEGYLERREFARSRENLPCSEERRRLVVEDAIPCSPSQPVVETVVCRGKVPTTSSEIRDHHSLKGELNEVSAKR
jgi:hypothetical protein